MLLAFLSKRKQQQKKKIVQVVSNLCLCDNKWQKGQQKNLQVALEYKACVTQSSFQGWRTNDFNNSNSISLHSRVYSPLKNQKFKMRISIGKCNLYETNHSYVCFFSSNLWATHGIFGLPSNLFLEIPTSNTMIGAQCTTGEIPFNLIISFTTKALFLKKKSLSIIHVLIISNPI